MFDFSIERKGKQLIYYLYDRVFGTGSFSDFFLAMSGMLLVVRNEDLRLWPSTAL